MYTEKRKELYELLRQLGATSRFKGSAYTVESVLLYMRYVENGNSVMVTKDIYPEVGKMFKVSHYIIERNIRSVIGVCWRINKDLMEKIAIFPLHEKPSNFQFLEMLAYYVGN